MRLLAVSIYLHMNKWLAAVVHMQIEKSNLTFTRGGTKGHIKQNTK
jgi:hypothetical protein